MTARIETLRSVKVPIDAQVTGYIFVATSNLVHRQRGSNACGDGGVMLAGKLHWRNTLEQLQLVGPRSLGVALLTAGFVGMVFTIQVIYSGSGGHYMPKFLTLTSTRAKVYVICCNPYGGKYASEALLHTMSCQGLAINVLSASDWWDLEMREGSVLKATEVEYITS